jgi:hypothetical protein
VNARELGRRVAAAKDRLGSAESGMQRALDELGHSPREDKSIISAALGLAFAELKAARQDLTELELVIAREA